MARKKKRRLKKSVKIGCSLILVLPIVLYFAIGLCVQRCSVERERRTAENEVVGEHDFMELYNRLDKVFCTPHFLDTSQIAIHVYDLATKTPIYRRHADRLAPPASCMKLLTAVAAMEYLGVKHRFVEEVRLCGEITGGTLYGTVLIQCDDDPMVESLEPMVSALKSQGIEHIEGDIVLDLLREDTLRAHPTAATWDIPYNRLPILLKGRKRIEHDLQTLLQGKGITLHRNFLLAAPYLQGLDPKEDATLYRMGLNRLYAEGRTIYQHSTPLTEVLAPMLLFSSNIKADALCYHIDHAFDRIIPHTDKTPSRLKNFLQEGLAAEPHTTTGFVINDGSGLSPDNRMTADFLVALLEYAWHHEDMRQVLLDEALAVPANPVRRGSLLFRMSEPIFRNKVFVKTGTLTTIGLSSLAGYAQGSDGRWYAFAIINENSPVYDSRQFQDRICKELVR